MDKRKTNGGARKGAGRKPKAEEQALIEKLSPLEPIALEALKTGLRKLISLGRLKMYMEYTYGKPKETKDITLNKAIEV